MLNKEVFGTYDLENDNNVLNGLLVVVILLQSNITVLCQKFGESLILCIYLSIFSPIKEIKALFNVLSICRSTIS